MNSRLLLLLPSVYHGRHSVGYGRTHVFDRGVDLPLEKLPPQVKKKVWRQGNIMVYVSSTSYLYNYGGPQYSRVYPILKGWSFKPFLLGRKPDELRGVSLNRNFSTPGIGPFVEV